MDSRLEWTYNGRLATVFPSNGGAYNYIYDSYGRRVTKNHNGSQFYYSGDTLVAETRAQGKYFEYMYDESGRPQGMYYYDGTKLNKYYFLLRLRIPELLSLDTGYFWLFSLFSAWQGESPACT